MKQKTIILAILLLTSAFTGCSSISSRKEVKDSKGLVYFLPLKDFKITLTTIGSDIKSITFGVTDAYPDRTKAYILSHNINLFGDNKSSLGISSTGLLNSATSSVDSQVNTAFYNLGKSIGMIVQVAEADKAKTPPDEELKFNCDKSKEERTYVIRIPALSKYLGKNHDVCGVTVTITALNANDTVAGVSDAVIDGSGIFYRQELPYLIKGVQIKDSKELVNSETIISTPSLSKTHFLPISKSFFANNKADFTFVDGVPTLYKQDTYSEFVNLFKLPGDIIGGFFAGIGAIFTAFKTNATDESEWLKAKNESLKAMTERDKYEYFRRECRAAVIAKDSALIQKFCIGEN